MAKDDRLYARFDIGMDEHPKIMLLSDAAFRALIEATLYARRQLTDGFLAEGVVLKKWGPDVAPELTTNHPERPSWVRVEGGWQIHDFAEHQITIADIEAKREAGRLGGIAKAKRVASKVVAPATNLLEQTASKPLAEGLANGYESLAKTETETETKKKRDVPEIRPDVSRICELLADLIEGYGSKRPNIGKGWRDAARLMYDVDHRDPATAERLMRWTQADLFWRGNVMSMPTFRAQYDRLRLAANRQLEEKEKAVKLHTPKPGRSVADINAHREEMLRA